MPAWALKIGAFAVTAMTLIGSAGYVTAHPWNPLAPLRPPLVTVQVPDEDQILIVPELPTPPPPTPTIAPTPSPARSATATPRATATLAPAARTATPRPSAVALPAAAPATVAPATPTPAPVVAIAPSVRATSKPALTITRSS